MSALGKISVLCQQPKIMTGTYRTAIVLKVQREITNKHDFRNVSIWDPLGSERLPINRFVNAPTQRHSAVITGAKRQLVTGKASCYYTEELYWRETEKYLWAPRLFAMKDIKKLRKTVIKTRKKGPGRPRSTTQSNNKFISCSTWWSTSLAAADIKAQLNESQREEFDCGEET